MIGRPGNPLANEAGHLGSLRGRVSGASRGPTGGRRRQIVNEFRNARDFGVLTDSRNNARVITEFQQ